MSIFVTDMIPEIHIEDYNYGLAPERIARYPLPERDMSKLLVYEDGNVSDHIFKEIPELLEPDSLMFFNETKVVPARLHFLRGTGAHIEIFCLSPEVPSDYNVSFSSTESCRWKCVIGNSKRWKGDIITCLDPEGTLSDVNLKARLLSRDAQTGIVEFSWEGGFCFSEVLDRCGNIPIPPYLERDTEPVDLERYQTMYARIKGSVAAPTAGLHFTDEVLERISANGIAVRKVCLHVGAGTFLPVKSSNVAEHPMHLEPFAVSREVIEELISTDRKVIAVGTTSVRTLESLFYAGVSIMETGSPQEVRQWAPYDREYACSTKESLQAIADYLDAKGLKELVLGTRIIIVPGFKFRIVDRMVTNFHQPESTLILLVSAFVNGNWREIYDHALAGGYRFLSYGDSSLLYKQ